MSQTLSKQTPEQVHDIEQLDLLGFILLLLRKSGLIVLLVILASAVAYAVTTYVMKPVWRAEAYLDAPQEYELGNYYALYNMYQLIDATPISLSDTHEDTLPQVVYQQFLQQVESYDVVKHFWLASDYYKQMQNGDKQHDEGLLEHLIASIRLQAGNPRNDNRDKIELTSDNPKQAAESLAAFMAFANLNTRQTEYTRLITKWKNLFDRVSLAANNNLEQDRQGQLVNAAIWKSKLTMMTSVQPLDNQFQAFRYLKTPVQPLTPTSPNKILWVLTAGFAGLLIGCALVIMLALRDYNRSMAQVGQ